MKAFFEEYGFVVVSAIVVLLLIGMVTPLSKTITSSMSGLVENLTTQVSSSIPTKN